MMRRPAPLGLLAMMIVGLFAAAYPAAACSGARSPGLGEELMRIIETGRSGDGSSSDRLRSVHDRILALGSTGREPEARALEEDAMRALGYRKIWLRCGAGVFVWRLQDERGGSGGRRPLSPTR